MTQTLKIQTTPPMCGETFFSGRDMGPVSQGNLVQPLLHIAPQPWGRLQQPLLRDLHQKLSEKALA